MKPKPAKRPLPAMPQTARAHAHALLMLVLGEGITLDEALAKHPLNGVEADQRFAMLLALTTLQHLGQLDAVLATFLEKPLPPKRLTITNALRMGAAQLLLLNTPAHAAVNETVTLVKQGKDAGLAGLVNAVLQKIVREKPTLPAPIENLPAWLRTRWEETYGAAAVAAIAQVASSRAPLDIHGAVISRQSPVTKEETIHGDSIENYENATRLDRSISRISGDHPGVEHLPGYDAGAFFVQDVAASYPVRLLGDVREHQVLDVCAAPGGKAMQLIQAGAFVTAIDKSPARMKRVKENLKRMRMQANTIVVDAFEWQPSRAYDAILLDAPCTATGTWRRHPEVVHGVSAEDIAQMVALQRRLLLRAWQWLKPGGKMVYCVCSLEPEEGEQQAQWFKTQVSDATLVAADAAQAVPAMCITPEGFLRTRPDMMAEQGGMDGFFAVCFSKN